MLNWPMSSPQMIRMFGRCSCGACACAEATQPHTSRDAAAEIDSLWVTSILRLIYVSVIGTNFRNISGAFLRHDDCAIALVAESSTLERIASILASIEDPPGICYAEY